MFSWSDCTSRPSSVAVESVRLVYEVYMEPSEYALHDWADDHSAFRKAVIVVYDIQSKVFGETSPYLDIYEVF